MNRKKSTTLEEIVQEENERYILAMAAANDGLWDWNLRTGKIFFSTRWKQMLGYEENEIRDIPDEWFNRVHEDDIDRLKTMLDAYLNNDTASFAVEYRLKHFNEGYRWMLIRGLAVRDSDGTAYRIAGSQTDITEKKLSDAKSIHDALHDTLTGLPNRTLFLDRIRQILKKRERNQTLQYAVIYIDLDRFRLVNESLGHVHGDELIIQTGHRLRDCVQPGDTVARLGGDEYAILMEDIDDINLAIKLTETIQSEFSKPFSLGDKEVFSSGSMGVAYSNLDYERPEDIIRDAELAMYKAKRLGNSKSVLFDDNFRRSPISPIDLDTDLRRALDRNEMQIHYQPIISLRDGVISGFEALLRWKHRIRGNISPSEFIPLAEETGLIYELGQWVLYQACLQTLHWNNEREPEKALELSINLSGKQFADPNLVNGVLDNLDKSGLKAKNLKLEITESVLMENAPRSIDMLNQLKEHDIKVCVDDFGTGYSSLSYLHTFPIDTLKVDRSFVNDMGRNYKNMEIIRTITMLAHNLKLDVIAEGVETAEQHAQLSALGCQYAQGFYFSRPVDSNDASNLIQLDRRW
ncbi:MAG: diguanylate cyclase [Rhodospirillaceae bacterium]|nr:diguanylate cyclase [Rhodospirillaceae bacterium]OUU23682.1 MAG: hypothetical protein CBB97_13050 [Candidatus Endolissoclinum sp. TMED37]